MKPNTPNKSDITHEATGGDAQKASSMSRGQFIKTLGISLFAGAAIGPCVFAEDSDKRNSYKRNIEISNGNVNVVTFLRELEENGSIILRVETPGVEKLQAITMDQIKKNPAMLEMFNNIKDGHEKIGGGKSVLVTLNKVNKKQFPDTKAPDQIQTIFINSQPADTYFNHQLAIKESFDKRAEEGFSELNEEAIAREGAF